MKKTSEKTLKRKRRHAKIRARISGDAKKPRLSVFRSNGFIYTQIINDKKGVTLGSVSDVKIKKGTKTERALEVGKEIAKIAQEKKIKEVVFDRGGYLYAGRIKAVAEGARGGGLKF